MTAAAFPTCVCAVTWLPLVLGLQWQRTMTGYPFARSDQGRCGTSRSRDACSSGGYGDRRCRIRSRRRDPHDTAGKHRGAGSSGVCLMRSAVAWSLRCTLILFEDVFEQQRFPNEIRKTWSSTRLHCLTQPPTNSTSFAPPRTNQPCPSTCSGTYRPKSESKIISKPAADQDHAIVGWADPRAHPRHDRIDAARRPTERHRQVDIEHALQIGSPDSLSSG